MKKSIFCIMLALSALFSPMHIQAEEDVQVPLSCTEKDAEGTCIKWNGVVRGCKAPPNGECIAVVREFGKLATCSATNGESCNAVITRD